MEPSKEPINVRITRMNNLFLGRGGTVAPLGKSVMGREGLLDALLVLYDECNNDTMKKDPHISSFVDKFRTPVSELRRMRVNISDFEVKKVIGRGHFGEVHVVREKQTGDVYAMKTLRKADTLSNKRAFYEEERDIMALATSPWLTNLQYAFQDLNSLYLIMEFHPGGDLLALLERFGGCLSEDMARFYLAEMVVAIHTLHQMGFVHRDIKPENILLDRCGHLKLADFGSAARLTGAGIVLAHTCVLPVGTPEYIAPEVLQAMEAIEGKQKNQSGHSNSSPQNNMLTYGIECDYWSLGIVAYEMVLGKTPFHGDHLATTYRNIQLHKKRLEYPDDAVSQGFKDMVSGLLGEVQERLGYDQLINHPFFADVDWVSLRDCVPPFVPVVNSEDDTSNFVEFERNHPTPSIEHFKTRKEFSGRNLPFVGFTYAKDTALSATLDSATVEHLEKKLELKKKEVLELMARVHTLEGSGRSKRDTETLERRAEAAEQRLHLVEQDRVRLEGELARARTEQQSLQRTLDLEMQETKNMEARAMELIKSAKEKWERFKAKENKEKDRQIEQLTDKVTTLNTANNELNSKLHRRDKEQAQLRSEVSHLQQLVREYKDNMAKTRQSQRESVLDVQSRLGQIAADSQSQLSDLQSRLDTECQKFAQQASQAEKQRQELERQLEAVRAESGIQQAKLKEKALELCQSKARIAEYERRLSTGCSSCTKLRQRITSLETELSESVMSFEQHETTIAAREGERDVVLEQLCQEKSHLEKRLQESRFLEEGQRQKLIALEQLMRSLEGSLARLEEENSELQNENMNLRDQNSALAKTSRRSSLGALAPTSPHASPRASTTTTITTTTVVAAQAEASLEPMLTGKELVPVVEDGMQLQILEATVDRLESQLEKCKESALIDRQAAQNARSELWRKEKELSNAKLDQRIAERELKNAQEQIKKLQEEKKQVEEDIEKVKAVEKEKQKEDKEQIAQLAKELSQLRAELRREKLSGSSATSSLEKERVALEACRNELSASEAREKSLQADLNSALKQVHLLEQQIEVLRDEVRRTDETCQELRAEKRRVLQQLEETQRSAQRLEVNNNVLKDTCSMLEEQLEDFERLTSTHESKEARLLEDSSKLQADLEVAQSEVRVAKKAANEEKSLRLRAEARIPPLETQLAERKEELNKLQMQVAEYKNLAERLTEQINALEERTSQQEVALHAAQRQTAHFQAEIMALKEEAASQLTRIHTLKETNLRLDQELQESADEERLLLERVERLQATVAEMEICHSHKEVKSDATLQQQAKLIAYLQAKLEEQGRRKKTLTDKLFGKRDKENQINSANIVNVGMKELEAQLHRERIKVNKLTEQMTRSSSRVCKSTQGKDKRDDKDTDRSTSPPREPLSPTTAKHLVLSPGSQATPGSFTKQASFQRMHHNIPHRFEVKLIMRASKCAACQDGVPFGRQAAVCQECGAVAHHRCTSLLPSTCGLPSGFARHFSQRWKKSKEEGTNDNKNDLLISTAVNMEGWLKLPKRGNTCWERRYVRLAGGELLVFAHEPGADTGSTHLAPVERFNLCPPDGVATVSSVTQAEVANTAKSDIPFIIKVEITPRTTCWPSSSQYLMAPSAMDKERWMEALTAAVRAGEVLRREGPVDRVRRYTGQVIARLLPESTLDITCILHISSKVIVMGAEEGLFSYHIGKSQAKPVLISGIGPVYHLLTISHLGLVVMIAGKNRDLVQCDLRQLTACAEAAECSQPVLSVKSIAPSSGSNSNNESCFHLLAVSQVRESNSTRDLLCAANSKKLVILRWSSSAGLFQQLKSLETQEPCSCILMTPHSIIVGCNKFFEIDAQDFSVEDFLDLSDKSLSHVVISVRKANSFPVAILDVTSSGGRCSPEYLVCFHQVGVFVDQYGRRSREDDLKWAHVPFAFAYRKPFLFIIHFASVEVMQITATSFTRNLNDSVSTSTEYPSSTVIELNSPHYLGDTDSPGGIYSSNVPAKGIEVVRIEGALACPDELGFSCSSINTASDDRDGGVMDAQNGSEFSFTSSLMQSLDEDDDGRLVTDDACSSSKHESDGISTEGSDVQQTPYSRHVHFSSGSGLTPHTAL